jgi:VWFA-related protein
VETTHPTTLHALDRVGLLTFSHELRLLAAPTEDIAAVRAALNRISAEGSTALRDAVQLGLSMPVPDRTRGLMILFTDGADTASWVSAESALDVARRAGMVVHVVRTASRGNGSFGLNGDGATFVEALTEATGGRLWSATSESDLESLFTAALGEMRARYLLTFQPKGPARPGWHEVKVRLRNGRADITARPGYFVG